MIKEIVSDPTLFSLIKQECSENGICVEICSDLMRDDDINDDLMSILKIDDYYNSRVMHSPPPSVDCLIVVKKDDTNYGLVLIELRNVKSVDSVKPKMIRPKFDTAVNVFLKTDFSHIFENERFGISFFKLWLVTNPYRWPAMSKEVYDTKVKGSALEVYQSQKPFRFRNKVALIQHKMPGSMVCL